MKKSVPKKGKKDAGTSAKKSKKDIKPENYFILRDGGLLKDIKELALSIEHMSDEEFEHHVNDFKNDFSSWAKDIFNELELAEELAKTTDKKDTQIIVLRHVVKKR